MQVHVLGTTGRQPPSFHVLEQRGYRGGAVGRGAKAYGLLEATGGRLGDAVLVAAVRLQPRHLARRPVQPHEGQRGTRAGAALLLFVHFAPPLIGAGALVHLRIVGCLWGPRRQPRDVELDLDAEVADLLEDGGATRAGASRGLELGPGYGLPHGDPAFGGVAVLGGGVARGPGRFRSIGVLRSRLLLLLPGGRTRLIAAV